MITEYFCYSLENKKVYPFLVPKRGEVRSFLKTFTKQILTKMGKKRPFFAITEGEKSVPYFRVKKGLGYTLTQKFVLDTIFRVLYNGSMPRCCGNG